MRVLVVVALVLLLAVPCFAQTFMISPVNNCWDFVDGFTMTLMKGTYHIEYVSGATSTFPDDTWQGGYVWQSHVEIYIYASAQTGTIGSPINPGWYQTFAEAETAAKGLYTLVIPANTVISFYTQEVSFDIDRCLDNRGSITLRFVQPLATEPTTWGAIKSLYR